MTESYAQRIAAETGLPLRGVAAVLELLGEGATVPFIARYRKEATGSLDEVEITNIRDREKQLRELDARKETILQSIQEQGLLTPDLKKRVLEAATMSVLEDIYLPYRPKRRTRATIAKEKGLEPLADILFAQGNGYPEQFASKYINSEKGVADVDEALAGARDIIAERVSEDERARSRVRSLYERKATIATKVLKGKEEEGAKFRDYFNWEESLSKAPSHRVLAMRRAEKEKIISMSIAPAEDDALDTLDRLFVKGRGPLSEQVAMAVKDGYRRLLAPSMETEMRLESKKKADLEAIKVFAENLRQLLLAAPIGSKRMLAIDPGFRTGCKVVALDAQGKLLRHDVIRIQAVVAWRKQERGCKALVQEYKIEAIAVGNGTAGRGAGPSCGDWACRSRFRLSIVNESGASIYSASDGGGIETRTSRSGAVSVEDDSAGTWRSW
ncbi:MAG: Tex-like N-terminal domain-containing protein [Bacteroidia bacterium]